jgi:hypothetical protein
MALVGAFLASACGYALVGRGNNLPDHIKVIGVPQFENQSGVVELDQKLTEAVRAEFQGRGRYRTDPDTSRADAVLSGTITSVRPDAVQFNTARQVSRVAITVVASVEFRDVGDNNKVLWANPSMLVREEYDLRSTVEVIDPAAFFRQDADALDRLAKAFARALVAQVLEGM